MTLIDSLAGIVILAATVMILAPLGSDAVKSQERTRERILAQTVLVTVIPAQSTSGEQSLEKPVGCTLRWQTDATFVASGDITAPLPARSMRFQIVDMHGGVLAERMLPLLDADH